MRHPKTIADEMARLADNDEAGGDHEINHGNADALLVELVEGLMPTQEIIAFEVRRALDAYARGKRHWWYA